MGTDKLTVVLVDVDPGYYEKPEHFLPQAKKILERRKLDWPNAIASNGFDDTAHAFNLSGYGNIIVDGKGIVRGVNVHGKELESTIEEIFAVKKMQKLQPPRSQDKPPLKAGIIGLDTSHVVAFTQMLNNPKATGVLSRVRVVAAYPGGSKDIPDSSNRVEGYTKTLREKFGVEIVDSIDELLKKVDVVLLESVDGRPHLEQVKPVFRAKKPVFIDKPVAGSLADAIEIYRLARESGTPCFSSSSLRFGPGFHDVRTDPEFGAVLGCDAYGPCSLEPHHPDLFWYGIHGVEALFTIMGTGCESVTRTTTENTEFATGKWKDGRIGTYRGIRKGKSGYGAMVFGTKKIGPSGPYTGYEPLVVEICKFFESGEPPVTAEETLEIYAFMEAADESKRQGGKPVTLASVLERAREKAGAK